MSERSLLNGARLNHRLSDVSIAPITETQQGSTSSNNQGEHQIQQQPQQALPSASNYHHGGGGGNGPYSVTGSDSALSATNSTSSSNNSFTSQTLDLFTTMIVSLIDCSPKRSWRAFIIPIIFNIYLIWTQLFVDTLADFGWGEYGSYIFSVILNFPTTLLFQMVPYWGVVTLSGFFLLLIWIYIGLLVLAFRNTVKPSKHFKKLKVFIRRSSYILRTFSLLMLHVFVGFFNCDLSKTVNIATVGGGSILMNALQRYSSVACLETQNIVMMVVAIIAILSLLVVYPVAEFAISHSSPFSKMPLMAESSLVTTLMGMCCMVQMILSHVIPQQYLYVSAGVQVILNIAMCFVVFYYVPFLKRLDNTLYFGFALAKLGASVGALVSSCVNLTSSTSSPVDGGYGFSILTLGLIVLGFAFGCVVMEFFIRFQTSRIRDKILTFEMCLYEKSMIIGIEKSATSIYAEIEESKMISALRLFLKLCLKQGASSSLHKDLFDSEISIAFIKGIANQKSFSDIYMLIYGSSIVLVKWQGDPNCGIFSQNLLKRATRQHPNILQRIIIQERLKQIEAVSQSTNGLFEITSQIDALNKNQASLLSLHRDFWKELASEHVNYENIEKLNRSIYSLTTDCKNSLTNLYFNYSHNKTILRLYASFIESFEFNKEMSQALFAEANNIEEEEMKKKRKFSSTANIFNVKRGNKVAPSVTTDALSKYNVLEATSAYGDDMHDYSALDNKDETMFMDLAGDAFEDAQSKKESMMRMAVASPKSHKWATFLLTVYFSIAFCIIAASIGLSVYYSRSVKVNVPYLQQVCFPSTIPLSIIRNVRAAQNWINAFYLFEFSWPPTIDGFPSVTKKFYINDHKNRLVNDLNLLKTLLQVGQQNVFDPAIYSDYSSNNYPLLIPNEDSNDTSLFYNGANSQRLSSIVEITNMIIKYTDKLIAQYPFDLLMDIESGNHTFQQKQTLLNRLANNVYMNPLQNYNYMFLWQNIYGFTFAYESFCQKYLDRSVAIISRSFTQFLIFISVSLGIYFFLSVLLLLFVRSEIFFLKKLIKLFERFLQKDTIGKIYHSLSRRTDYEIARQVKSFSLSRLKPNIALPSIILLLVLIVFACVALMFVESYLNAQMSSMVLTNVRQTILTATGVQSVEFDVGEIVTYYAASEITRPNSILAPSFKRRVSFGDLRLYKGKDNLDFLFDNVVNKSLMVSESFSKLIYGDLAQNAAPLIGMYPSVDKLITVGFDGNCTEYLQRNNIAFTYASNLLYCQGLEKVLTDFLSAAPQVSTDARKQYILQAEAAKNGTLLDIVPTQMQLNNIFRMSLPLTTKFVTFISEFVKSSSQPSNTLVTIFSILGICGTCVCAFGAHFISFNVWNQIHSLRMMLNYVPVEILDRNDNLKNYILNHSISFSKHDSVTTKSKDGDSMSDLKLIFNSSVEGTILSKESGEIELFNNAGLSMFGIKIIEILGTSMYDIFDSTVREDVRKAIEKLLTKFKQESSSEANINQFVETMEISCIRRNHTQFPAKINFYIVKLSGRHSCSIVATLRDITLEKKQTMLLNEEKQKSDNLLKNILPTKVANRLKNGGDSFIAEKLDDVTCFFSDMVGFTAISSNLQASDLVLMLNTIVNGFDALTEKYNLEKIKTIGDAYFCVGGLHDSQSDHPERVLKFAIDTFNVIYQYNTNKQNVGTITNDLNIRVGINTGAVVAGVIGTKKFAYDLWGDTINVASRMESTSLVGRIQVSRSTYARVYDLGYEFEEREVELKGKGIVKSYLLNEKHHRQSKESQPHQTIPIVVVEDLGHPIQPQSSHQ
ncbi:hypothetical protein C9374_010749 [Naegleria lovaniensis]|uniref:Adenylate and Guanylate cyclase catalytic domain containing protein n=1 Tax=Naegleria lovaniensis TaxID=51637 RepID=A0AA88KD66_NAELO|nr:uncharacterized protein C9374_010749 [Naegleria lovaniensis]KAG2374465.1 hypothetical protein C9374_010749 [Naegleria lovaniensis]